MWCIPPSQNAAFVAAMEDVLEVYSKLYNPAILGESAQVLTLPFRKDGVVELLLKLPHLYEVGFHVVVATLISVYWFHVHLFTHCLVRLHNHPTPV